MSYFRYNGNEPTEIKYGNDDVKALKYGSDYVWAKAFTLTITTNTGVNSISVKRTAALVGDVATNVLLSNGAIIYYGDTLEITATPSTYYSLNQTSPYTVTVSGNTTVSPTATRNTNTITVTVNSNVSSISVTYYNTSGVQTTTQFTSSGSVTAQQGRAYSWTATANSNYTMSSSSGSGTLTSNTTISPTASPNSYTITFALGGSNYGSWGSSSKTAYYGDRLTRSGNSFACLTSNSDVRWTNTFTNGSATGYTYNVTYNLENQTFQTITGALTITATTSRTANNYAVSIAAGTGVSSVYLSTSSTATSGSASGTSFAYGSTVYGFAVLTAGYNAPSGWTLVSGTANTSGAKYRVGSLTVSTSNSFGTKSANIKTYTLTITKNSNISTIYYKVNGASSWSSTSSSTTVSFNYGTSIYWYATAASGYKTTYNSSSNYATITTPNANQTISPTAELDFVIQNPVLTGEKASLPRSRYNALFTVTNPNSEEVTCYYRVGSSASYSSTTISAGGTFNFNSSTVSSWPFGGYTGYVYFTAQGQTSATISYQVE